jgi:hypothetical protein
MPASRGESRWRNHRTSPAQGRKPALNAPRNRRRDCLPENNSPLPPQRYTSPVSRMWTKVTITKCTLNKINNLKIKPQKDQRPQRGFACGPRSSVGSWGSLLNLCRHFAVPAHRGSGFRFALLVLPGTPRRRKVQNEPLHSQGISGIFISPIDCAYNDD